MHTTPNSPASPRPGPTAAELDAILPQTQCTRCGFSGCRPYAEAMATGSAPINRCPPGGTPVIEQLAAALGLAAIPLDPQCGETKPLAVAQIDPDRCIGCLLCIRACPVDAIAGAFKHLHVVIEDQCSGCELCIAPCPVDCIAMVTPQHRGNEWTAEDAQRSRERHRRVLQRQNTSDTSDTSEAPAPRNDLLAKAMASRRRP